MRFITADIDANDAAGVPFTARASVDHMAGAVRGNCKHVLAFSFSPHVDVGAEYPEGFHPSAGCSTPSGDIKGGVERLVEGGGTLVEGLVEAGVIPPVRSPPRSK